MNRPKSFSQVVLDYVRSRRGRPVSISETLAAVGYLVSAARAARYAEMQERYDRKRWPKGVDRRNPIDRGRRAAVQSTMKRLAQCGRLVRLSPGVYARP